MKFLVDAQLPRRLAQWLSEQGHDALHTLDMARGNCSTDAELMSLADSDGRIVVTKDDDFVQSFMVVGRPAKLWLISTGNIRNADLLALIAANLPALVNAFESTSFVELSPTSLVVHE